MLDVTAYAYAVQQSYSSRLFDHRDLKRQAFNVERSEEHAGNTSLESTTRVATVATGPVFTITSIHNPFSVELLHFKGGKVGCLCHFFIILVIKVLTSLPS